MDAKTLKGKLHIINVDYNTPGIPVSVATLKPVVYQEGHGYMAWYEGEGKKYYGFGDSASSAMLDFDKRYQAAQPKPQALAEASVKLAEEQVFAHALEGLQHWLSERLKPGLH